LRHHTPKGRPVGPYSIGRALDIPSGSVNDDLRLAVEAIDKVHGVGHLPRIPMEFRTQLGMHGRFDFDETTGEPIRILIDRRTPHRTFVAIHEIGHLIDLAEFGEGPIFGTTLSPILSPWSEAIEESAAFRNLSALIVQQPSAFLLKQLRPDELWSRSYTQYIAIRAQVADLDTSLESLRTVTLGRLHNPFQWEDNDFENIAAEIEALFVGLGWRE
jgi:hypothetical protein